jgi:hypothetical protein
MSQRFAYAIDKRYLPLLVPFGLRGSKDGVTLTDDGSLSATFGFFKIKTPLANVTEAHITRNYRGCASISRRRCHHRFAEVATRRSP